MNPDIERFERWAATYDKSPMQRWLLRPVHAKMLDLIGRARPDDPPSRILDIGCGTGRLLKAASVRWPDAELSGVDPAEGMIAEAKRLNPGGEFKVASAELLPFADEAADLVLSSLSFHHWIDQERGQQEIARVLRPGGWFCLADHTFVLTRLAARKVRTRTQVGRLLASVGLAVKRQARARFILITLAQKASA